MPELFVEQVRPLFQSCQKIAIASDCRACRHGPNPGSVVVPNRDGGPIAKAGPGLRRRASDQQTFQVCSFFI